MSEILDGALAVSLVLHIVMITVCVWRVWRGENMVDRLIGVDLIGTLMLAVLVLVALITRDSVYMDVALGLAALGFFSTIAFAKYVADQRMF